MNVICISKVGDYYPSVESFRQEAQRLGHYVDVLIPGSTSEHILCFCSSLSLIISENPLVGTSTDDGKENPTENGTTK